MTETKDASDKSVPQAVERVMNQLKSDNSEGALKQIHDEVSKPGVAPEANKQFLSTLTKQCQEQGYLPKLAVDFGKTNFKTLDLDGNQQLDANELSHIVNDKKMQAALDPFQREMAAYLLANNKEINAATASTRGSTGDITPGKLDTYAKKEADKYQEFFNSQKMLSQFGNQKDFAVVDKDKDGYLSTKELEDQLDFANRMIAMGPEAVKEDALTKLSAQKEALTYMKENQSKISAGESDSYYSNLSLKDIQKHAEKNPNPREKEHIPNIDDKMVAPADQKRGVDLTHGTFTPEVMVRYHMDHVKELDLNGDSKVSKRELDKILNTPAFKETYSPDEQKIISEMRNRFDQISAQPTGRGGSREITFNSMAEYVESQKNARENEKLSTEASALVSKDFKTMDKDKNGWLSEQELSDQKDFYARMMAADAFKNEVKEQKQRELEALEYLEKNKSNISSARFSSDMTLADIQKDAAAKKGKISDVFKSTEVEAGPISTEKKSQAETENKNAIKRDASETVVPQTPESRKIETPGADPQPQAAKTEVTQPQAAKTEVPQPQAAKTEVPQPQAAKTEVPQPQTAKREAPADRGTEGPKLEGPRTDDPAQLQNQNAENERIGAIGKPNRSGTEANQPTEVTQKIEPPVKTDIGNEKSPFKYTEENYADALQAAHDQNKPVVLVFASSKDSSGNVKAGGDANADGKAIVIHVDRDNTDANSPLSAYANNVLKQHNDQNRTEDQSLTTVFNVHRNTAGRLIPEAPKFVNYGDKTDAAAVLKSQIESMTTDKKASTEVPVAIPTTVQSQQLYTPTTTTSSQVRFYNSNQRGTRRNLFKH